MPLLSGRGSLLFKIVILWARDIPAFGKDIFRLLKISQYLEDLEIQQSGIHIA